MDQLQVVKEELFHISEQDKNSYFICGDCFENITFLQIKQQYPDRFINYGISEANGVSLAAGLALSGKTVFLITPAIYASARALEQIRVDVGYNKANVKILAFKPALKFNADAGYSHWSIEDIANIRSVPNMTILNPATLDELKFQLDYAYKTNGPFYIRIENLHSEFNTSFEKKINDNVTIQKGKDIALVAEGSMVEYASNLLKPLKKAGINAALLNVSTIKPFNKTKILKLIDKKIPIVTLEEQTYGGIGSIVSEVIAEYGRAVRFMPIRISNERYNIVGKYDYIADQLMDLSNVPNKIAKFANKKYRILGIPIITLQPKFKVNLLAHRVYKLFGILPILKMKQRNKEKKGKFNFKCYLFGFLRII